MRTYLWGSRKGILIVSFLLSKFEQQSLNVAVSSCGRGSFRKRSSCGRGYFFIRIKKMCFHNLVPWAFCHIKGPGDEVGVFKISGYVWTRS